jgi:magnesium-protoporphyrin O-methyltransferase
MSCCNHCEGVEKFFDKGIAAGDLKEYQENGPSAQSRLLLNTLQQAGVEGMTLIDIGGGVGAIHHELLKSGVRAAVDVDASSAYIAASREEAARLGHADRLQHLYGNFVDLAPQVEPADIVTLDRVICCYPDMHTLVRLSSERAVKFYGLVYPRESWWMKVGRYGLNGFMWLLRNPFRFFIHSSTAVEEVLRANGFKPHFRQNAGLFWQVRVYARM